MAGIGQGDRERLIVSIVLGYYSPQTYVLQSSRMYS
jgi:hypothetical protein